MKFHRDFFRNATLLLGGMMPIMAGTAISPSLPKMRVVFQDVSNVDLLVRLVLTFPGLFIALGAPCFGYFLDKWGRKPVLLTAILMFGGFGSACYFVNSLGLLLVFRAMLGLAVAGVMTGFITLIADYFSGPDLNRFMGYQAACMGFGGVLSLTTGGILADISWRAPFLIFCFAFIVFPAALFFLPEPDRDAEKKEGKADYVPFVGRTVAAVYVVAFVGMILFFMIPVQVPFYLMSMGKISHTQIGFTLASMTLTASALSTQYHRVRARFSFRIIFIFLFLMMTLGYTLLYLAPSPGFVVMGLVTVGLGMGFYLPNLNVWLVSLVPLRVRGRAVSGLTTCIFLGQFLSPVLLQPVVSQIGIRAGFGLAAIGLIFLSFLGMVKIGYQR